MKIGARFLGTLAMATLLGGCSGELLAGGQRGTIDARATDDPQAAPSAARATGPSLSLAPSSAAAPEGTVDFVGTVSVLDPRGQWVQVTDGAATAVVRLGVGEEVSLGAERVEVGTYTRARVAFQKVEANVTGGVLVGGVSLTGRVRVEIGASPLVVEAPVALVVRADQTTQLIVDLDAAEWLPHAVGGTVPAAAFRSAVDFRVR